MLSNREIYQMIEERKKLHSESMRFVRQNQTIIAFSFLLLTVSSIIFGYYLSAQPSLVLFLAYFLTVFASCITNMILYFMNELVYPKELRKKYDPDLFIEELRKERNLKPFRIK